MACPEHPAWSRIVRDMPGPTRWICGVVRVTGRPLLEFSNRLAEFACLVQFFQNVRRCSWVNRVDSRLSMACLMAGSTALALGSVADAITAGLESPCPPEPVGPARGLQPAVGPADCFPSPDWWLIRSELVREEPPGSLLPAGRKYDSTADHGDAENYVHEFFHNCSFICCRRGGVFDFVFALGYQPHGRPITAAILRF